MHYNSMKRRIEDNNGRKMGLSELKMLWLCVIIVAAQTFHFICEAFRLVRSSSTRNLGKSVYFDACNEHQRQQTSYFRFDFIFRYIFLLLSLISATITSSSRSHCFLSRPIFFAFRDSNKDKFRVTEVTRNVHAFRVATARRRKKKKQKRNFNLKYHFR